MKIMLCGASDLHDILPLFKDVASKMGFQPLNYLSGEIYYHQYGEDKWTSNSILTIENADILIFVINSNYGNITWKDELPKTIEEGKNFLIFCRRETYDLYLQVKSGKVTASNQETQNLLNQLEQLESGLQLTIVTYQDLSDFKQKLKSQLNGLYQNALTALQQRNKRASLLPILKKGGNLEKKLHPAQIKIAKEMLFDVFEQKELRKRTLGYFCGKNILDAIEISQLFVDSESGIARKAVVDLAMLVNDTHDLDFIFEKVIECCSENEVGFVRRAIKSLIDIDITLAIKHMPLLFPVQDVGTPRRIITYLYERRKYLVSICNNNSELKEMTLNFIELCIGFKTKGKDWKELGKNLSEILENTKAP